MKLLRVDSSARRNSVSRQLTARFAEAWQQEHPQGEVIERDLATTTLPHITDEWVQAVHSDPATHTADQKHGIPEGCFLVGYVGRLPRDKGVSRPTYPTKKQPSG